MQKKKKVIVNPLMGHPNRGWVLLLQRMETYGADKSYCICRLYDHQPRTDLKTYILDYEELE